MCRVEQKKNYIRWVNASKSGLQIKDVIQKLKMLKTRLDLLQSYKEWLTDNTNYYMHIKYTEREIE